MVRSDGGRAPLLMPNALGAEREGAASRPAAEDWQPHGDNSRRTRRGTASVPRSRAGPPPHSRGAASPAAPAAPHTINHALRRSPSGGPGPRGDAVRVEAGKCPTRPRRRPSRSSYEVAGSRPRPRRRPPGSSSLWSRCLGSRTRLNLEFSLDKTLEGIYARERQEQLQLKTLQTKLKLTDEQAAEMDLLGAVRKELARQRAENGEPEELPNPIVEKLQKTLRELPPLPDKRKKKKRPPLPRRRRKPPQLTEVEMLRREMAKSRAKAQVLEKEMCLSASKAMGVTGPRVFQSGRFSHAEAYVQAAGFDTLVKTVTRLAQCATRRGLDEVVGLREV